MKSLLKLICLLSVVSGCRPSLIEERTSPEELTHRADSLLDAWHAAASRADFDAYFGMLDSASIFVGTDPGEHWTKKEFLKFSKPFFDRGKAWTFEPLKRNIFTSTSGDVIWFDELLNTWMGTCIGSGVLEKNEDGDWRIRHYVLSITIPNEDVDEVLRAKRKRDSVFLRTFGVDVMTK